MEAAFLELLLEYVEGSRASGLDNKARAAALASGAEELAIFHPDAQPADHTARVARSPLPAPAVATQGFAALDHANVAALLGRARVGETTRAEIGRDGQLIPALSIRAQGGAVVLLAGGDPADEAARRLARVAHVISGASPRAMPRTNELAATIGRALADGARLDVQLAHCAEAVVRSTDAIFTRIYVLDARAGALFLRARSLIETQHPALQRALPARLDLDHSRFGEIARTRASLFTRDLMRESEELRSLGPPVSGLAVCSLVIDARLVGLLIVGFAGASGAECFAEIRAAADQLALAVDRARSEDRNTLLARLVEESSDLVGYASLEGDDVQLNEAGARLVGLQPGSSGSLAIVDLFVDDDRALVRDGLARARTGASWEGEARLLRRGGQQVVPAWVQLFALRDRETGHSIALAMIARDITRQKGDAAALLDLAGSLERRVSERTAQLQETNRELEAFSYSVSHDLRAPIRHISGFADLLRRHSGDQLDARGVHYLDTIVLAARRAGQLIDDLLDFSRIGRTEVRTGRVELDSLVAACLAEVVSETGARAVEWDIARLPAVRGDAAMLRLVVKNLLSNAVKYSRTREAPHVEVRAQLSGEEATVSVRDNGVGFDMQHADKLFGVFQRLHRADEFEGSGIGLANVKRIVQRHGGRVWADSAVGAGATFFITLPLAN